MAVTYEHSCFTNLVIKWLAGGFDNLCLSCLIVYGHTNHRTDISSSQLTSLYNPHSNLTNQILNASINFLLTLHFNCLNNPSPVLDIWLSGKHWKKLNKKIGVRYIKWKKKDEGFRAIRTIKEPGSWSLHDISVSYNSYLKKQS